MKMSVIGEKEVGEKFGVMPNRVRDVQALAGDSTRIFIKKCITNKTA